MRHLSKSLRETATIASSVLSRATPRAGATVLALYGDLGSGKTTFVQRLAQCLGITEPVQSPTFVIMKSYKIEPKREGNNREKPPYKFFIHIDAYRLEQESELEHLGWKDIVSEPDNLIAVEWAERIERLLPRDAMRIRFKYVDNDVREIEF